MPQQPQRLTAREEVNRSDCCLSKLLGSELEWEGLVEAERKTKRRAMGNGQMYFESESSLGGGCEGGDPVLRRLVRGKTMEVL